MSNDLLHVCRTVHRNLGFFFLQINNRSQFRVFAVLNTQRKAINSTYVDNFKLYCPLQKFDYLSITITRLTEAVLTSTHDLCFRAKIRKNVYHCKPQFYYIKLVYKGV